MSSSGENSPLIQADRKSKEPTSNGPLKRATKRLFSALGCSPKPETAEQRLTENWLEKWRRHGRFPFKLLIHAVITILCTVSVLLEVSQDSAHTVATRAALYETFYPEDSDSGSSSYGVDDPDPSLYLYTVDDVADFIDHAVQAYYDLPETSVDVFRLSRADSEEPSPPVLRATLFRNPSEIFSPDAEKPDVSTVNVEIPLALQNLGAFTEDRVALKRFLHALQTMEMRFEVYNYQLLGKQPIEHGWTVTIQFDFTNRGGRIEVQMLVAATDMPTAVSFATFFSLGRFVLDTALIGLCVISAVISLRDASRAFNLYQNVKRRHRLHMNSLSSSEEHARFRWRDLPWSVKLRFFNKWFIIALLSHVCLIAGALLDILTTLRPNPQAEFFYTFFLGFGSLLAWVNMMRYLEFNHKYLVLLNALATGVPNVTRFVVGAMPIFIGYALWGTVMFSSTTERFASFDQSFITLFSLQAGDDLQATFRSVTSWVSRLYLYSFLVLSIYGIANIFIAIIDDAYFSAKGEDEPVLDPRRKKLAEVREAAAAAGGGGGGGGASGGASASDETPRVDSETGLIADNRTWEHILATYANEERQHDSPGLLPIVSPKPSVPVSTGGGARTLGLPTNDKPAAAHAAARGLDAQSCERLTRELTELVRRHQEAFQAELEQRIRQALTPVAGNGSDTRTRPDTGADSSADAARPASGNGGPSGSCAAALELANAAELPFSLSLE